MRFAPVILALLLALSPVAVATQATGPTDVPENSSVGSFENTGTTQPADKNTTAVLTLGTAEKRTSFETASISLGNTLATDRTNVENELSIRELDRQLQTAGSNTEKKQILNRYRFRIENRVISLQAEEQRVTQAFTNGSISASEYVRELGRIDAEAGEILRTTEELKRQSESVPGFTMPNIKGTIRGKLLLVLGPVRHEVGASLRGVGDATRVYIAASESGIVLTTIDGGQYVREVVRRDQRKPGASKQLRLDEARALVFEQYTWAKNHQTRGTSTSPYGTTNAYSATIGHPHGQLTAYLDSGTEAVFKEVQYKSLMGNQPLPPGPGVTNTSDNVTLVVNRTYPGGPLRLELRNETGSPVDGAVTVAGHRTLVTGQDGVAWTLGPIGKFRVSGTHDGTTVNVTARPTKPKAVSPNNSTKSASATPA
ncbi:DUF7094 domain-containing protein [Halorussus halophilus]|uniref:DUF7094 domain-containing protein n=1 Tax=Halorussus halophilus TaxID=2650975 RepID=UPI001300DAD4|nr:hypothetical protein [Halorussus halophilus]